VLLPTSIVLNLLLTIVGFNSSTIGFAALLLNAAFYSTLIGLAGFRFRILRKTEGEIKIVETELDSDEKALDTFDKTLAVASYP
jgi:hypothetical protein